MGMPKSIFHHAFWRLGMIVDKPEYLYGKFRLALSSAFGFPNFVGAFIKLRPARNSFVVVELKTLTRLPAMVREIVLDSGLPGVAMLSAGIHQRWTGSL